MISTWARQFAFLVRGTQIGPFRTRPTPAVHLPRDLLGLFYSEDVWRGRITTCLHWAGLARPRAQCVLRVRTAVADSSMGSSWVPFLLLGVMLCQTARASYGMDLDSGFRFGHALVSAVQVGTVLTTGMLACLLKLIRGYGRPLDSLGCLAVLSPFCIATFSRGPLLAFFAAALCLSLYRRIPKDGGSFRHRLFASRCSVHRHVGATFQF